MYLSWRQTYLGHKKQEYKKKKINELNFIKSEHSCSLNEAGKAIKEQAIDHGRLTTGNVSTPEKYISWNILRALSDPNKSSNRLINNVQIF